MEVLKSPLSNNSAEILATLNEIHSEQEEAVSMIICDLTYHASPKIRAAAFRALLTARNVNLSEIIRDGLSDPDKEVFCAAATLFHRDKQAA